MLLTIGLLVLFLGLTIFLPALVGLWIARKNFKASVKDALYIALLYFGLSMVLAIVKAPALISFVQSLGLFANGIFAGAAFIILKLLRKQRIDWGDKELWFVMISAVVIGFILAIVLAGILVAGVVISEMNTGTLMSML